MNLFQIFKIIMGLMVAGFFLFFALKFAGIYAGVQTGSIGLEETQNLKKAIEDVYIYDVDTPFRLNDVPFYAPPPYISKSRHVKVHDSIPFFFKPGKDLIVYKKYLDLGFTEIGWVGVLPRMKILYNPLNQPTTNEDYRMMFSLTELFPQTERDKIGFGFCNGAVPGSINSTGEFLGVIKPFIDSQPFQLNLELCTRKTRPEEVRVIISETEEAIYPEDGVFLRPIPGADGVGLIYFMGENVVGETENFTLVYKDPLDILSVLAGGIDAYEYKNRLVFEYLDVFARNEIDRAKLLAFQYSAIRDRECPVLYSDLESSLVVMGSYADRILNSGEFTENLRNFADMNDTVNLVMKDVQRAYSELEDRGC